jgi:hypothetical protein
MSGDRNLFRMSFGTEGTTTLSGPTGGTAKTGNWGVLQVLADTVIETIVDANETETNPLNGKTLLAGTVLYGKFTSIDLTDGFVRLYKNLA